MEQKEIIGAVFLESLLEISVLWGASMLCHQEYGCDRAPYLGGRVSNIYLADPNKKYLILLFYSSHFVTWVRLFPYML